MTPTQHPSDATLIAFTSGSLSEGFALVVGCHLTACAECRRKTEIAEIVGGAVLTGLPAAPLAASSLTAALSRLDAPPPPAPGMQTRLEETWLPEPLHHYHLKRWRRIGPGIRQIMVVRKSSGGSARLLRLAPGVALPLHGHSGVELACVLRGSFSDQRGRFGIGDFSEVDDGFRHRPISDPKEECICLVATSGPLRLYGVVGRLIQMFLGF
ncbi:MAG TPA: ChrR family anti-sigma-E factor [Acetobacteraceae bacterium]|nr:ChrR family anti-sigma-E factor [Acetobacteraceae bacterium]